MWTGYEREWRRHVAGEFHVHPRCPMRIAIDEPSLRWMLASEQERGHGKTILLLAHCNAQLKPLVIAALHTGLRKSALLSLRWGNIDFWNRLIKVQASYTKISEAHRALMTETLTATLKKLKMSDENIYKGCNDD